MRIYILLLFISITTLMHAQVQDRDCIRRGNKHYREGQYAEAEVQYRKAIESKPSIEAYYNLANSLLMQNKDSVAYEMYKKAVEIGSPNNMKRAQLYHNMGDMLYAAGAAHLKSGQDAVSDFQMAVDLFKSSLRCNPNDDETRYNLAMAQHQLKKAQQQKQNKDKQNKDKQNKDKQNKDNKDNNQKDNKNNKDQDKNQQNKNQNKDQNQDQDEQNKPQNKDKQNQNNSPQNGSIDPKTAEQLLNSAQQDEQNVLRKVNQRGKYQRRGLDKDW